MSRPRPRLHHELLLLALHDRKGTHVHGQMLHLGLGGAIFTELLLEERIRIVEEGGRRKKQFVEVLDTSSLHEDTMDAGLAKLASAKRRARPPRAVSRIGGVRKLRHEVAKELCRKGILRATEDKVLLIFTRKVYPEVDPGPERELIERIRASVEHGAEPDERTAALIGLASASGVLPAVFDRKERKAFKKRIAAIRESGPGSDATRAAIEAAQAAVVAAITAASAASAGG